MKFIFCLLLSIFLFTVSLLAQCLHTPKCPFNSCYYGGDGLSKSTAYQIWTTDDLTELSDSVRYILSNWHFGKHFRLMQDISDSVRQPIWGIFRGHFHGGGHKINVAMVYDPPLSPAIALFTSLYIDGSIDSLTLNGYGAIIVGSTGSGNGMFASVSNCTSNVSIIFPGNNGGSGIVGHNKGIVYNCVFNGTIIGINQVGGIAGINDMGGHIINCINNGKITATNSGANTGITGQPTSNNGVGGIVGSHPNATGGSIRNNINTGSVEGQNMAGGIVGVVVASSGMYPILPTINNINYGFVKGNKIVGGILGWVIGTNINISNNSNFGVVVGEEDTGCIVGKNNGGNISNNHYDKQMCGE